MGLATGGTHPASWGCYGLTTRLNVPPKALIPLPLPTGAAPPSGQHDRAAAAGQLLGRACVYRLVTVP